MFYDYIKNNDYKENEDDMETYDPKYLLEFLKLSKED